MPSKSIRFQHGPDFAWVFQILHNPEVATPSTETGRWVLTGTHSDRVMCVHAFFPLRARARTRAWDYLLWNDFRTTQEKEEAPQPMPMLPFKDKDRSVARATTCTERVEFGVKRLDCKAGSVAQGHCWVDLPIAGIFAFLHLPCSSISEILRLLV
jgi:hypothetical protein